MASPGKKSFLLRIDPALWALIEQVAAQELRSTNAQVEVLLREALARRGRLRPVVGAPAVPAELAELAELAERTEPTDDGRVSPPDAG